MSELIRKIKKSFRLMVSASGRRGLSLGIGAAIEHQGALKSLNPATIVDMGANKGQFSLFCEAIFPDAYIYAFEPLPEPAALFRKLFAANDKVKLFEMAVAPEDGETQIHLSKSDDSSSLLPITDLQNTLFPGTGLAEIVNVKMSRLDSQLSVKDIAAPALLKIDVQGFELDALKGSQSLLNCFAHIYVECSYVELYEGQSLAPDVIDYLNSQNFELAGKFNKVSDNNIGPIQADFLFTRRRTQ
jgi:FkbM family methyltransferase